MSDIRTTAPLPEDIELSIAGYVLGDLTVEEADRLAALARQHPQLEQAVQAMQASFNLIPQALPTVEPPAHLRSAFVRYAEESSEAGVEEISQKSSAENAAESYQENANLPTDEIFTAKRLDLAAHRSRARRPWLALLAGFVALAALLLAADNLRLRNQLQLAQTANPEKVAAILQQPNSRLITLTGEGSTTDAAGTLLFTPGRWQEVVVSLGNLPPLPPEQIYRLWLALENGEVIYCGEFNTDSDGSVFVRFTPLETPPAGVKATELAVTIEAIADPPEPAGERVLGGAI